MKNLYPAAVRAAVEELKKGRFVFIYDHPEREGETDFIMAAEFATASSIRQMRKYGGGLIFLAVASELQDKFCLPYMTDVYNSSSKEYSLLSYLNPYDIPYDNKSSFSLTINHRKTYTGITDRDRAMTVSEFAHLSKRVLLENIESERAMVLLGEAFRSPGHVPICIANKEPLVRRFGHTELSIALLKIAGLTPVAVGCEMMGDDDKALPPEQAALYAADNNSVFLEGREIIEAFRIYREYVKN
ncbi:MAG: 3,4-dihydroxy-2-butanone-4-phosphate synthase [Thermoplasmata archaeon]